MLWEAVCDSFDLEFRAQVLDAVKKPEGTVVKSLVKDAIVAAVPDWKKRSSAGRAAPPTVSPAPRSPPGINNYGVTVNYTISPTTFFEATYGQIQNELAGGNEGGILTDAESNRNKSLASFPILYPQAGVVDQRYYGYQIMQETKPPFWDGKSLNLSPTFGSRWDGRLPHSFSHRTESSLKPEKSFGYRLHSSTAGMLPTREAGSLVNFMTARKASIGKRTAGRLPSGSVM